MATLSLMTNQTMETSSLGWCYCMCMLAIVRVLDQANHCLLVDGFTNGGVRPRPLSTTFAVKRCVLRAIPVDLIQGKCLFVEI